MQYQYHSLRAVTGKECTLKKSALHMQGSCFAYYCFFHVIVAIAVILWSSIKLSLCPSGSVTCRVFSLHLSYLFHSL